MAVTKNRAEARAITEKLGYGPNNADVIGAQNSVKLSVSQPDPHVASP